MKRRFTDADKWRDKWFRKLSVVGKLAWQWLLDNCDHAGVIDPDWELASFQIGEEVGEEVLAELESRVETLPEGALFIPKYMVFQYKTLSRSCLAHKPAFESIEKHNLRGRLCPSLLEGLGKGMEGYGKGKGRVKEKEEEKEKEKDKEKDRASRSAPPTQEELVAFAKEVPCSEECALAYQNDRRAINWTKVKGGLQVTIEDWRSDLRGFAMHWRANEAKSKAEGRSAPVARGVDTRPEKTLKL